MTTIKAFLSDPVRRTVFMGLASGALIAFYGLYLSRDHITFCGHAIHLANLEAETLFIFIDVIAIYGKMLMSNRLVAKTRRIGRAFLIAGGSLSLICNVASGIMHNSYGAAAYGAFIVTIVGALEYAVANTKGKAARSAKAADAPAPAPAAAATPKPTTKKCAAGCTCRKHNRTRTPKVPAAAPVSPGPMGPGPAGPSTTELDELVGAAAYI